MLGSAGLYSYLVIHAQVIPWHYLGDDDIVIGLVRYDAKRRYSQVTGPEGERIPSVVVIWFAWQAFYPETELWKP